MPLYAYGPFEADGTSNSCCHFETLQSMNEAELTHCPTCGHPIGRVVAPFGIGSSAPSGVGKNPLSCAAACPTPCHQAGPTTSAGRIAEMATRHVCSAGCCHK
jgi:hypothetical protein